MERNIEPIILVRDPRGNTDLIRRLHEALETHTHRLYDEAVATGDLALRLVTLAYIEAETELRVRGMSRSDGEKAPTEHAVGAAVTVDPEVYRQRQENAHLEGQLRLRQAELRAAEQQVKALRGLLAYETAVAGRGG